MEIDQRFCLNKGCASRTWLVQAHEEIPELWVIAEGADGSSWCIAATEPVCPHCGSTLRTAAEIRATLEQLARLR